jgi:hypothetical protein
MGSFTFLTTLVCQGDLEWEGEKQVHATDATQRVNRQIQALLRCFFLPVLLIYPTTTQTSARLFIASLSIVLYREGLPSWYVWTGFITILLFVLT